MNKTKLTRTAEAQLLKKTADKIQSRIINFESKYGKLDRENLYGKVNDMVLIEWEGERETLQKVRSRLKSLKIIPTS